MSRLVTLVSLSLLIAGCAGMKFYSLPLTPEEGQLLVPALISTSESMGLRSFRGASGAVTELEDGTSLSWQTSANKRDFILVVDLPGDVPPEQREARWHEAKVRADQIWQLATESRQQSSVGAAVLIAPGANAPGATSAPPAGGQRQCRYGTDCGPGELCRDRGDGVQLCMGNGGAGAYCSFGTDCAPGLFCRNAGSAKVCQP